MLSRVSSAALLTFLLSIVSNEAQEPITHTFLAMGAETRIINGDGHVTWRSTFPTRDGWVLPDGHILLAVSKCDSFPKGGVVELTRSGETVFQWQGTQAEVNTVQALPQQRYLVTEAGPKPRVLEIDRQGQIRVKVPIECQLTNFHMQTRMTRKLPNGNYLVPQLLDKVVREYTPEGRIVWEAPTPNWAFTAIRLPTGNTLVGCTYGNMVVELDPHGKIAWQLTNDELPGRPLHDACGVQRLPNGHTVVTSYGAKAGETRLTEVTPDKRIVWTYTDDRPSGIHEFQILDTNGKALEGGLWR
jgi:hypothetical protein